jgi:hypothetical protein
MPFDIVLPSVLFFLTAAAVFLYPKLEIKVKSILEERKFSIRDVVVLVVFMGIAVTAFVIIPDYVILALFLIVYCMMLFLSTYIVTSKWYLGLLLPSAFFILYFVLWNAPHTDVSVLIFMDVFAAVLVVFASVYMGTLFGWETVAVFAGLITVMDVIQVLVTGFMVESATKIQGLKLPVMIFVPTFPLQSSGVLLGLGDFLLPSLLTIQTARKYGRKFGYVTIVFIAASFLVFEFLMFHFRMGAMPATVFIDCGWLAALGARYLYNSLTSKKALGEKQ